MFYNSANRDERAFPDPYRFDVTRTPNEHVGFGAGGPHFCLGANLARREITVMFEELFRRLPDIEITGEPDMLQSASSTASSACPARGDRAQLGRAPGRRVDRERERELVLPGSREELGEMCLDRERGVVPALERHAEELEQLGVVHHARRPREPSAPRSRRTMSTKPRAGEERLGCGRIPETERSRRCRAARARAGDATNSLKVRAVCHGLRSTACQHTNRNRPPGRSWWRMFANAAGGSSKNITPN